MPAAKGSSVALSRTKEELAKYKGKLTAVRKSVKDSAIPDALMGAGAVLGGAALTGAARAVVGDDWMGVPTDVAGGLIVGGISVGMGMPMGVFFAAGMLSGYVADATKDAVGGMNLPGMVSGETDYIEEDVFEEFPEVGPTTSTFANQFGG